MLYCQFRLCDNDNQLHFSCVAQHSVWFLGFGFFPLLIIHILNHHITFPSHIFKNVNKEWFWHADVAHFLPKPMHCFTHLSSINFLEVFETVQYDPDNVFTTFNLRFSLFYLSWLSNQSLLQVPFYPLVWNQQR